MGVTAGTVGVGAATNSLDALGVAACVSQAVSNRLIMKKGRKYGWNLLVFIAWGRDVGVGHPTLASGDCITIFGQRPLIGRFPFGRYPAV